MPGLPARRRVWPPHVPIPPRRAVAASWLKAAARQAVAVLRRLVLTEAGFRARPAISCWQ